DAELALDLELDRQPVAVPAGLARDEVAAHRPVAREDVLKDAREHVVGARPPVRGRWPLVENEPLPAFALAYRLVEDIALTPALEDPLFEVGKRLGGVDGLVGGHEARCYETASAGCRCGWPSTRARRWRTAPVGMSPSEGTLWLPETGIAPRYSYS